MFLCLKNFELTCSDFLMKKSFKESIEPFSSSSAI